MFYTFRHLDCFSFYIYQIIVTIKINLDKLSQLGKSHTYHTKKGNDLAFDYHGLTFYAKAPLCSLKFYNALLKEKKFKWFWEIETKYLNLSLLVNLNIQLTSISLLSGYIILYDIVYIVKYFIIICYFILYFLLFYFTPMMSFKCTLCVNDE